MTRLCDHCERKHLAKGMCSVHYYRMYHYGRLDTVRNWGPPAGASLSERLDHFTDKSGDCWLWTGTTDNYGYGVITISGKVYKAHRVVYEETLGEIGEESLDHLCANTLCVRPMHLEPVSMAENARRAQLRKAGKSS